MKQWDWVRVIKTTDPPDTRLAGQIVQLAGDPGRWVRDSRYLVVWPEGWRWESGASVMRAVLSGFSLPPGLHVWWVVDVEPLTYEDLVQYQLGPGQAGGL